MAKRSASATDEYLEDLTDLVVLVFRLAAWLLSLLLTNVIVTGLGAVVALTWSHWGEALGIATAVVAVLALAALRLLAPVPFQLIVANPAVASLWGGWVRWRWSTLAARHDLVARSNTESGLRQEEVARLGRITASPGLLRLRVRLPAGLTPTDVAAACEGLAHAFRVQDARVAADRPGFVWLELHRRDLLQRPVGPLVSSEDVNLASIPVGRGEDDKPWCLSVLGTHLLLAGATGAGKSSVLWSLINGLSARIRSGTVQVWAIDPKGGMELGRGRPLFERYEDRDPEAMCELVEELVRLKDTRARELAHSGSRVHRAAPGSPHLVLIVDELATLTAFADRKTTTRVDTALGLLLTQGRACGITVVSAVQDPTKAVVGWRDLFPTRIAMRLDNQIQVDMVLGDGARETGARADHISELTPGVAFVRVPGTRQLRRVRASYLNDAAVDEMVRSYAPAPTPLILLEDDAEPTAEEVA